VEASHIALVVGELAVQDLKGNLPSQRLLFGKINIRHSAAPQPPHQGIVRKLLTRQIWLRFSFDQPHTKTRDRKNVR
jgi:hypothetical protein